MQKTILIIGGGFGGVQAALSLSRKKLKDTSIRLIDPKTHFEYHAALYRFVTGSSPMEACIPYRDIFQGTNVDVMQDSVESIDLGKKTVTGTSGSRYTFDTLIIALGSMGETFGIDGVSRYAYGMTSAKEAVRLKKHIADVFDEGAKTTIKKRSPLLHIVVVGGGPTGVELAGELSFFASMLAKKHNLNSELVHIDLVDAADRLLGNLPEEASIIAEKRLQELHVNVIKKQGLTKEEAGRITLGDRGIETATVIWTAGVKAHPLLARTLGITVDRKGRAEVNQLLQAKGHEDVFVIGDGAATKFSGMAQTALYDGEFVAKVIDANLSDRSLPIYQPKTPLIAIPIGQRWALVVKGACIVTGYRGWLFRRFADLRLFMKLLPFSKALRAFRCGYKSE